jgi:hypothetical protein
MNFRERYDNIATGALAGFLLPLLVALFIFIFSGGDPSLAAWIKKISRADIVTHIVSLSVFTNLAIFLIFNYFDMLRATKGVLGVTIFWAVVVFLIKFLL